MDKLRDYLLKGDYFKEKGTLKEFVRALLRKGSFQNVFGVSDQVLDTYYQTSWRLLEEKRFEEASDAFFFLVHLNPFYHSFWLGLGIAEQAKENYGDAAFAYLMAQATQKEDPIPYMNSARCFLALGEKEVAKENVEQALEYCGSDPKFSDLKIEAKELEKVCY